MVVDVRRRPHASTAVAARYAGRIHEVTGLAALRTKAIEAICYEKNGPQPDTSKEAP